MEIDGSIDNKISYHGCHDQSEKKKNNARTRIGARTVLGDSHVYG